MGFIVASSFSSISECFMEQSLTGGCKVRGWDRTVQYIWGKSAVIRSQAGFLWDFSKLFDLLMSLMTRVWKDGTWRFPDFLDGRIPPAEHFPAVFHTVPLFPTAGTSTP